MPISRSRFDIGAHSSLNVAFGVQHHKEVFKIEAGDTESWAAGGFEDQGFSVGSNGFQGFSADVAGRFSPQQLRRLHRLGCRCDQPLACFRRRSLRGLQRLRRHP